jgi:hypothetical protein
MYTPLKFYLNIVRVTRPSGIDCWEPCFMSKYIGSTSVAEARQLRHQFYMDCKNITRNWKESDFRTVRVAARVDE